MVREKLRFGTSSNLGGIGPGLEFSKRSGKNSDFELAQISIGGIGPGLEFFQTVMEKLGFGTCSNLNWGN
jgi:hypothetical protein